LFFQTLIDETESSPELNKTSLPPQDSDAKRKSTEWCTQLVNRVELLQFLQKCLYQGLPYAFHTFPETFAHVKQLIPFQTPDWKTFETS
jgi:hypothetical protein